MESAKWRRAWRDKILPALVHFHPDLILISAGFDAHRKDLLNQEFIGLQERDYEWVTDSIMQVSHSLCSILSRPVPHPAARLSAAGTGRLIDAWLDSPEMHEPQGSRNAAVEALSLKPMAASYIASRFAGCQLVL